MTNQQRRQNLKQKCDEEGPNPSEDLPESGSANSFEQFTALLHKQARTGDLYYRTCISTQGVISTMYVG